MNRFDLMPVSASTLAPKTDALYYGLLIVSALITLLVVALIVYFAARYRRGSSAPRGPLPPFLQREFEIGWTTATLFAFLFFFWWAGSTQIAALVAPASSMEIHVVAKQWMWKIQHPNGIREINTLHVPIGEPVRLVMISQDVIHSFFVPAFRLKRDILPGRYVETWFEATKTGTFGLMCTQFCGAEHSAMMGTVVVMSKTDFAAWLVAQPAEDLAGEGKQLFVSLGCSGCHAPGSSARAPDLAGVYGRDAPLAAGGFAKVDDAFVRDMMLEPETHAIAGYKPIMPSFKNAADEGQILALTAYIRALGAAKAAGDAP